MANNRKNKMKKTKNPPRSNQIALYKGRQCITPPPYCPNIVVNHTFHFQWLITNAVQRTTISSSQLCALFSMGTVVNSTVTQIFNTVRVRRLEMWGINPTAQDAAVIGLNFAGSTLGVLGDDGLRSDTSSTIYPAMLDLVPPRKSQASQWQPGSTANGNQTLFEVYGTVTGSGTATAVLRVHCTLKSTPDSRTTNNNLTVASSVLGAIYYMALDNNATGAGTNTLKADLLLPTTT